MKIFSINIIKKPIVIGSMLLASQSTNAQILNKDTLSQDLFEYRTEVPAKGTKSLQLLSAAPSPYIQIQGETKIAKIVVDLSTNILYKYDDTGMPEIAYLIASGKKSTPTDTGVRVVLNIERYPYRGAPANTKRRKNPLDYGPRAIIVNKLDPKTGKQSSTGEFIHGNRNPESLGNYASKGCIRMDNEVIKQLATEVKRGDIILIQRNGRN